jgi:NAD(P)-dependent dehydrogenase (short-subunit alcohol dehydrogenase family)
MSSTDLDGRVAVVTGAGRGLGRAEALALAGQGARVVVNDFGGGLDGSSGDNPADEVVEEIRSLGGQAVAHKGDVADWDDAHGLLELAITTFGDLNILVNNAGILRDRMIFSMSEEEWDAVIRVHLKGHFCTSRAATAYWRDRSKATGEQQYARVINTASEAWLFGSAGQPNYAAAKAGIAALTLSIANGTGRYGVRANCICPRARTRMTEAVFGEGSDNGHDPLAPENVAPLVAFLASPAAEQITGQVFVAYGSQVTMLQAPPVERTFSTGNGAWTPDGLAAEIGAHFAQRDPLVTFAATHLQAISG